MTTSSKKGSRRSWVSLAAVVLSGALAACLGGSHGGERQRATEQGLSTITWIQTQGGGTGATSATFAQAQNPGDLNVVIIGWGDDTTAVTSVTDTSGNAYAVAAPMATGTGTVSPPLREVIYYARNIAGGTNTVTAHFSGAPYYPDLRVLEYGGLDPSTPFDVSQAASGTGSSTTVSSGSATTHTANELIVGAGMTTDRFAGAGSSFTQRIISSDGNIAEDKVVSSTGSYSASAVLNGDTQSWLLQMVAFRGAGTPPPPPPPSLASVSPTSGATAGGTSVTLTGTSFVSGATVAFCGTAATNVTFVSSTTLTATTPAHAAAACAVEVQNPDGQASTLGSAFTYVAPSGSIAWVQTKSGGHGATSATFAAAQTAGNLNVVVVGWGDDTSTITSVSDRRGNAYVVAAPMATCNGSVAPPLRQAIYYARNIAGGTNTVTVQFSGTPAYPDLRMLEYRGADPAAPFDVTAVASGTGSSTSVSSGSATTSAANEIIVGAGMTTDYFAGPGSSFTQRVITADGNIAEDRVVSETGSYGAPATLDANTQSWLMQMVSFKASGGGTCTPTTCAAQGASCGSIPDGCGGTLDCGSCTAPATCGGGGTPNVCGTSSGMSSYTTSFPLTENPISEGGHWIGGQTAGGNLWGNVETTPGMAFGVTEPTQYGDPTALLTGTWASNQTAHGTVRITGSLPTSGCCREIELRLRQTISPSTITGYEVYCSLISGTPYCHVASWGGPNGVWANLDGCFGGGASTYLRDGDVLEGTVTGTNPTVVTAYINGAQVMQVADTGTCTFTDGNQYGPWTSGSPGIGFYGGSNDWSSFGWSTFSASSP